MKHIILVSALLFGCSNPPPPRTIELDLCAARAAYKVVAAAANGKLDPEPGSLRAKLEADEDVLCSILSSSN